MFVPIFHSIKCIIVFLLFKQYFDKNVHNWCVFGEYENITKVFTSTKKKCGS